MVSGGRYTVTQAPKAPQAQDVAQPWNYHFISGEGPNTFALS